MEIRRCLSQQGYEALLVAVGENISVLGTVALCTVNVPITVAVNGRWGNREGKIEKVREQLISAFYSGFHLWIHSLQKWVITYFANLETGVKPSSELPTISASPYYLLQKTYYIFLPRLWFY